MRADLVLTHAFRELTSETATLSEKLERLSMVTPWIANMFGIGGQWVMGFALAVTAVVELYTHWDTLLAKLGNDAPLKAAQAIEEFAARTKTAMEEFKKSAGMAVGEEADITGAYKHMATGPGAKKLQGQLADAMAATGSGAQMTDKEKAFLAAETPDMPADIKQIYADKRQEISQRIHAANTAEAERIISESHAGKTLEEREEARKRMALLVKNAPRAFDKGMGAELESLTPEGIERDSAESDAGAEAFDADTARWRKLKAQNARKRKEAEERHKIDEADFDQARKMQMAKDAKEGHAAQQFFARQHQQQERADQQAEKSRPLRQAEHAVQQTAAGLGIGLTDTQTEDAARAALAATQRGANRNQAVLAALERIVEQAEHQGAQIDSQISNLSARTYGAFNRQMGADQTANFSGLPPFMPGAG